MKSYITFEIRERPKNRKTDVYVVKAKSDGTSLGIVKWRGPWRRYVFLPANETLWSSGCMAEVTAFIDGLMEARRKNDLS